MKKPSTDEILKAYEKFGDQAQVATLLGIEDWEVLEALAKAPPSFLLGIAVARTLDTLVESLRHLRKRLRTMKAPSTSAVSKDLGKLLIELQTKRKALGAEGGSGLGLSEEEEGRLAETVNALGSHGDSNGPEADDPGSSA